jgi:hypothetical protein
MIHVRITPPGDNNPPDAPVPSHPTHPGRMVDTSSRTAALLRYAGLIATDVAPGADATVWVTMAEAEAEIARRGITVDLPEPLPPLTPAEARWHAAMLRTSLRASLIRLRPGSKQPVETGWQHAPALTEDEAVDWLVRGDGERSGNCGIRLSDSGPFGWAVLDAEDAAATALFMAAGLVPTAMTALAQDETSPKFGGRHFYLPLPDGIDRSSLRSTLQKPLEGGGLLDVLVGARFVVAPGSILDCAPGVGYAFTDAWLEAGDE